MFKALVAKEWVQLRTLRWAGLGLGVLLPLALLGSAEAGTRGWLPAQKLTGYSTETLFLELHPILLLVLWGLLGLLISSQVFSGDRAAGTEQFLLERPVTRDRVWGARLLVGSASLLLIVVGHLLAWWPFVATAASGGPIREQALKLVGYGGPLTVVVAFSAGLAAASLLSSPIQGVLLGIVLGVVPAAAGTVIAGLFPFASYRGASIGLVLPVLLLVAYVCGSFLMLCRGEPAGRGRFLRGGLVLGSAALAMPILFVSGAPLAMRLDAGRLEAGATIFSSGSSPLAVALNGHNRSAWLVDVEAKRRLRFLSPPVFQILASPDGDRTAVIRSASSFGRFSNRFRAEIYDAAGKRVAGHTVDETLQFFGHAYWASDHLVARTYDSTFGDLLIIDPDTGDHSRVPLDVAPRDWTLLGPDSRGNLYIFRAADSNWPASTHVVLQRIDPGRARIDPVPILEEEGFVLDEEQAYGYFFRHTLSPEGRYLVGPGRGFHDLITGEAHPREERTRWEWLEGDRLAWLERHGAATILLEGAPGEASRALRTWQTGTVTTSVSPDRKRLLVKVHVLGAGAKPFRMESGQSLSADARVTELWLYETATGQLTDATDWIDTSKPLEEQQISWSGPQTLALTGVGTLALQDLGPSTDPVYLIGSP